MFSKRTDWELEENAYAKAVRRHRDGGRPILDLTASNPTTCGFTYDKQAILAALADASSLQYDPEPKGLLKARESVARYYSEKSPNGGVNPENLVLTTGTSEAYSFLFRLLCDAGDEVLVAQPSYPLFDFLAEIQDVNLRPFELVYDHGWQIDFHNLKKALSDRTRAVLLVHPNNPTGHFTGIDEANHLSSFCDEHGLALIVDEVFLDYEIAKASALKEKHGSFIANRRALTFVLSGLSKVVALPQMKLGWIAANGPAPLLQYAMARLEVIADTYLSLSAPLQCAVPALLAQHLSMRRQLMSRIDENLNRLDALLATQTLVSRLEVEGGWYAVLRVPAIRSDEEIAIGLLDQRSVLVHPGHFYYFSCDGYLVVSLLIRTSEFTGGMSELLSYIARL
jgi:alanine-synthesizing transaminase